MGRIVDHAFCHASRQRYLNFDVELSSESVNGKNIEDANFAVRGVPIANRVLKCDFCHRRLTDQHRVQEMDCDGPVLFVAEQHFEGVVHERNDADCHRQLLIHIEKTSRVWDSE